jgi:DNA-binding YbaB/EbfC family protein
MMNMMNMMKQAQNIQKKLMSAQEELANMSIVGSAGNGSVSVTCDGKGQFKSIKLSAEAINPENPSSVSEDTIEMLEDIITTAINQTSGKAIKVMEEKMKSVTGGVNIPGLTM